MAPPPTKVVWAMLRNAFHGCSVAGPERPGPDRGSPTPLPPQATQRSSLRTSRLRLSVVRSPRKDPSVASGATTDVAYVAFVVGHGGDALQMLALARGVQEHGARVKIVVPATEETVILQRRCDE